MESATRWSPRMAGSWREAQRNARLKRVAHNLGGAPKPESEFLIWIPCNPLKSPDSDD